MVADVTLIIVALAMLGLYVRRVSGKPDSAAPKAPSNWKSEIDTGIRIGPRNAALTIIEFMDLECPYCAAWAARVDSLMDEFPGRVQLVYHHYPLPTHARALAAAVAAECAERQSAFEAFQRVIFAEQKLLGALDWLDVAVRSGVRNLDAFCVCIAMPADSFPRIRYGVELGKRSGVRGTPTVWVNGIVHRPALQELRRLASTGAS
jgi:protein-disulfide isomerase